MVLRNLGYSMINIVIAAFAVLFCWVKVSKNTEEQTQLASWTKTIILGVLTYAVIVFYLKTYQVTTVANHINIHNWKGCVDSIGNNLDTIKVIRIINKFSPGITENLSEEKLKKSKDERSSVEMGSIYVGQQFYPSDAAKKHYIKYNVKYLRDIGIDTLYDSFAKIPLKDYYHVYNMCYIRTSVPSMIPLLPSYVKNDTNEIGGIVCQGSTGSFHETFRDDETKFTRRNLNPDGSVDIVDADKKIFDNAFSGACLYGDVVKVDTVRPASNYYYSNIANTFNFFTAADISQYIEAIDIQSDCYVEKLIYTYDLPIAINPYDSCMVTNSNSFSVRGKYLNDNIVKGMGLQFHVTLPTLANLQLIRSLILTTILTALVAMLFTNIFYLFRKYSLKFIESHKSQISEARMKSYKVKIYIVLFTILFFITYITYLADIDSPLRTSLELYSWLLDYYIVVLICLVIIVVVSFIFLFRKVYTQKKK